MALGGHGSRMGVLGAADVVGKRLHSCNVSVMRFKRLVACSLFDILFVDGICFFDLSIQCLNELVVGTLLFGDLLEVLGARIVDGLILLLNVLCMARRNFGEPFKHG